MLRYRDIGTKGFSHFRGQRQILIVEIDTGIKFQVTARKVKPHVPAIQDMLGFRLLQETERGLVIDAAGFADLQCLIDDQRLGGCDHVFKKLGNVAAAERTHMNRVLRHIQQVRFRAIEKRFLPTNEESQSALSHDTGNCRHAGVDHVDPFFRCGFSHFLRRCGSDGAMQQRERPGRCAL